MDDDDVELERVAQWPLWERLSLDSRRAEALERKQADDRTDGWVGDPITGYDLIPDHEHGMAQCMKLAQGNAAEAERLFELEPAGKVYYLYAMQTASDYHYLPTDQTEPAEKYYPTDEELGSRA